MQTSVRLLLRSSEVLAYSVFEVIGRPLEIAVASPLLAT